MISEFAKEKVYWTKKLNLKLVRFIESRPNIWNPKHPKYTSVKSRDLTYNEFAIKCGHEFTGQAVKDRWTNIRSTFANYLRKLNASRARMDGEEYKVNWHLWEPCQFLMKVNKKNHLAPSTSEDIVEEDHTDEQTQEDENVSTEDENSSERNNINNSTCKSIANNLVQLFKDFQNDAFGLGNSKNGRVGRTVAKKLSEMNSFDAAKASQKIMEILLLYDENNTNNPNYLNHNDIMYTYLKPDKPCIVLGDSVDSKQFIKILKERWQHLHDKTDVFKYKIGSIKERTLDGKYLLQLNPDRGSKRRMPEKMDCISQPFDENKFNFTMVSQDEIIFNIVKEGKESDIHSLIVNVSPISRYHTLLCLSLALCLPQVVTEESLQVALDVMFLAQDRDLRIGFNSLCGMASVNHLHYHLFLEPNSLPIETAKTIHTKGPLFLFKDYPLPGFCFQVDSKEAIGKTSQDIYKLITYFLKNSIAHNLMISRGQELSGVREGREVCRVVVWPRKKSSKVNFSTYNIATCEMSGWLPIFDEKAFHNLTTKEFESELRTWKVDHFDQLCEEVKLLF